MKHGLLSLPQRKAAKTAKTAKTAKQLSTRKADYLRTQRKTTSDLVVAAPPRAEVSPWVSVTGVLVYDPDRGHNFRKQHKFHTLVLELPNDDLDIYYHWLLARNYGTWHTLQRPMFGKHITVIRGDEKPLRSVWKKHEGKLITVEYNPTALKRNWQFWNLPVRSTELEQLRVEAGLAAAHDFHITIGRNYEWQPVKY